jgi:hypothetical protein
MGPKEEEDGGSTGPKEEGDGCGLGPTGEGDGWEVVWVLKRTEMDGRRSGS